MEPKVKEYLSVALNAMINLAEASGTEVRMAFQAVAIVVKPGRSAEELMQEFERNEKLVKIASDLAPLLMSLFSIHEFRSFCYYLPNSGGICDDLPVSGSPRSLFEESALLLCARGLVLQESFWDRLEQNRPGRVEPTRDSPLGIRPLRRHVLEEFAGN